MTEGRLKQEYVILPHVCVIYDLKILEVGLAVRNHSAFGITGDAGREQDGKGII